MATIFYATTGSNTAASGTNAPTTAVTAGTVSVTSGNATITLSATRDLTGVLNNGEDVVWVNTSTTNRHLFRVTSFTGGVATCTALVCAETSTVTASGLSWAIGGAARLSLDADTGRPDIEDASAGWIQELQGTGVTYTLTAASLPLLPTGGSLLRGPVTIRGASGATVTMSGGSAANDFIQPATSTKLRLENMTVTATNTTNGAYLLLLNNQDVQVNMRDCTLLNYSNCVQVTGAQVKVVAINCDFRTTHNGTGAIGAVSYPSGSRTYSAYLGCVFHNCGLAGATITTNELSAIVFDDCIFRSNAEEGLRLNGGTDTLLVQVKNCVFYSNAGTGLWFNNAISILDGPYVVLNNIFDSNGVYGIGGTSSTTQEHDLAIYADYNAFRNNTSGARQYLTAGTHDVTLTVDPFTSVGGLDFSLNSTAGGGAACTDTGFGRTT